MSPDWSKITSINNSIISDPVFPTAEEYMGLGSCTKNNGGDHNIMKMTIMMI